MGRKVARTHRMAEDAIRLLGAQVREARVRRGLTAEDLADSAGVSRRTVSSIENGSPSVSVGNVLHVAAIVSVPLFGVEDRDELTLMRRRGEERVALLPARVSRPQELTADELDF